jgi:hypothetical protein
MNSPVVCGPACLLWTCGLGATELDYAFGHVRVAGMVLAISFLRRRFGFAHPR